MGIKNEESIPESPSYLAEKCQGQHKFFVLNACSKSQFVLSLRKKIIILK